MPIIETKTVKIGGRANAILYEFHGDAVSFPFGDEHSTEQERGIIDPMVRHTQVAIQCFKIMDEHLKYNILGLGDPARFMGNQDALRVDGVKDIYLQAKISQQLCYSCLYWAHHLKAANIKDEDLMNGLEIFLNEHLLHWFEVLSLIGNLDSAHRAIRTVLELLKSTSSDLYQLLSDALRFISNFYQVIEQSALHTYYSALTFTPRNSLLYRRYVKETMHDRCGIDGGPTNWGSLIANLSHSENPVETIQFSHDGTMFASCSEKSEHVQGILKVWDAITGTPISTFAGYTFAVANDFSTIASSKDNIITFYDVNGSAQNAMFKTPSRIRSLALSSESSRLAASLEDGTVCLWDSRNGELITNCSDGCGSIGYFPLQFSPTGARLAYLSANNILKLRDGFSGRFIADLHCGSDNDRDFCRFVFSADSSRIASLSENYGVTVWDSASGELIATVRNVDDVDFAISANGSPLATASRDYTKAQVWTGSGDLLAEIEGQDLSFLRSMVVSDNMLAIATSWPDIVKLYNVKTHSLISTLSLQGGVKTLAFSPDRAYLAAGNECGSVYLWDIRDIQTPNPSLAPEKSARLDCMAFSRDCSRLACGFHNSVVELWRTSPKMQRIASHNSHTKGITCLGFTPCGRLFASGSEDGTIELWNGEDGSLCGTFKAPGPLSAMALSNNMLIAAWKDGITLWTLTTSSVIHTFKPEAHNKMESLSISDDSNLVAIIFDHDSRFVKGKYGGGHTTPTKRVRLFGLVNLTFITTFDIPDRLYGVAFLPDNSQLMVQCDNGGLYSLNLIKHVIEEVTPEQLIQLPNIPVWSGIPIWYSRDFWTKTQHHLAALFSRRNVSVPVLWIPKELSVKICIQGSSKIALALSGGDIILVRLPTNHVKQ